MESNRRQVQVQLRLDLSGAPDSASRAGRNSESQSTEMLERSSRQLEEAARQALETEEVSMGVMEDLSTQRDVITNVRRNMRTIGTELSSARQSLTRMLHRAQQNRLVTLVICAVLGLGLTVWVLCFLGLPMKTTLLIAVGIVCLAAAVAAIR